MHSVLSNEHSIRNQPHHAWAELRRSTWTTLRTTGPQRQMLHRLIDSTDWTQMAETTSWSWMSLTVALYLQIGRTGIMAVTELNWRHYVQCSINNKGLFSFSFSFFNFCTCWMNFDDIIKFFIIIMGAWISLSLFFNKYKMRLLHNPKIPE